MRKLDDWGAVLKGKNYYESNNTQSKGQIKGLDKEILKSEKLNKTVEKNKIY